MDDPRSPARPGAAGPLLAPGEAAGVLPLSLRPAEVRGVSMREEENPPVGPKGL
jgi:hypothetical protein